MKLDTRRERKTTVNVDRVVRMGFANSVKKMEDALHGYKTQ